MATDVNPARENIFIEETDRNSSISERYSQKVAGSINFINDKQHLKHSFHLNGSYTLGVGSTGPDGYFPCYNDMEISGFYYSVITPGASGSSIVDVHLIDADGADREFNPAGDVGNDPGSATPTYSMTQTELILISGQTISASGSSNNAFEGTVREFNNP